MCWYVSNLPLPFILSSPSSSLVLSFLVPYNWSRSCRKFFETIKTYKYLLISIRPNTTALDCGLYLSPLLVIITFLSLSRYLSASLSPIYAKGHLVIVIDSLSFLFIFLLFIFHVLYLPLLCLFSSLFCLQIFHPLISHLLYLLYSCTLRRCMALLFISPIYLSLSSSVFLISSLFITVLEVMSFFPFHLSSLSFLLIFHTYVLFISHIYTSVFGYGV